MFLLTIVESIFLSFVIFAFHATDFNKNHVELPVMQQKRFAWPHAFLSYAVVLFGALYAWNLTLGRK